jgi:hypothetical protein
MMPLSLSDILENKAVVVFSYGEDTITIQYRPYMNDRRFYKQLVTLSKRATMPKPEGIFKRLWWTVWRISERRLCVWYLNHVIIDWDVTEDGKQVEISKALKELPDVFIKRLYFALVAEVNEALVGSLNTDIKKK